MEDYSFLNALSTKAKEKDEERTESVSQENKFTDRENFWAEALPPSYTVDDNLTTGTWEGQLSLAMLPPTISSPSRILLPSISSPSKMLPPTTCSPSKVADSCTSPTMFPPSPVIASARRRVGKKKSLEKQDRRGRKGGGGESLGACGEILGTCGESLGACGESLGAGEKILGSSSKVSDFHNIEMSKTNCDRVRVSDDNQNCDKLEKGCEEQNSQSTTGKMGDRSCVIPRSEEVHDYQEQENLALEDEISLEEWGDDDFLSLHSPIVPDGNETLYYEEVAEEEARRISSSLGCSGGDQGGEGGEEEAGWQPGLETPTTQPPAPTGKNTYCSVS